MTILRFFGVFFLVAKVGVSVGQSDSLHIKSKTCTLDSAFYIREEFDLSGQTIFFKWYESQRREWFCGSFFYDSILQQSHTIEVSSLSGYADEICVQNSTFKRISCISYSYIDDDYLLYQLNYLSRHPFRHIQHFTSRTEMLSDSFYHHFMKTRDTSRFTFYEYSPEMKLVQEISLSKSGDTISRIQHTYDTSSGLLRSIHEFSNYGHLNSYEEFFFDPHGRLIEKIKRYPGDTVGSSHTINHYNGTFLLETKFYWPIGTLYSTHSYTYDASGQILSETITDSKENKIQVRRWAYEYY